MDEDDQQLDLRRYLTVLWRRLWVIVLCGVIFAAGGLLVASQQKARYDATTLVQILDPNAQQVFDGSNVRPDVQRDVQTQEQVVTSSSVRAQADKALGSRAADVTDVSVSNVADTNILKIRVVGTSAETARDGANAIADAYLAQRKDETVTTFEARARELRKKAADLNEEITKLSALIAIDPANAEVRKAQRTSLASQVSDFEKRASEEEVESKARTGNAQLVESADLPAGPFDPKPAKTAILAGLVGLLLGLVLVLLLDRIDDKVSVGDVEGLVGAPVLGMVRLHEARRLRRHHLPDSPRQILANNSDESELFRTLRTNLRFSGFGTSKRVLMVTSPTGSEGKSTVTANLAMTLTESNLRVVAISADLRRPTLAGFFGVDESDPGLTSVLVGETTIAEVAQRVPTPNGRLYVVPAGQIPSNPAELLESPAMAELLRWLIEAGTDYVLIDSPPVLPVTDPAVIAQHVDGVVVVCVPGQTRREDLREAGQRLRRIKAEILGVVVNGVPAPTRYGEAYRAYPTAKPPASPLSRIAGADAAQADPPLPHRNGSEAREPEHPEVGETEPQNTDLASRAAD